MNNPLMRAGGQANPVMGFMQWYQQASKSITDPNAYLQQLIQSGKIDQNRINAAQAKAQMFSQMYGQFLK